MLSTIRRLKTVAVRVCLTLAVVVVLAAVASACPTCKDGIAEADPQQQSMAAGYYYSILFMMLMPFAILGTFGGMAYLSIRRARGQRESEANDRD